MRFLHVALLSLVLGSLPLGHVQETQAPEETQEQASQTSLEAQRAELSARENVLAEARAALEPQRAEVRRRRALLNQQLAALDAQEMALQLLEETLAEQENVSAAQREAAELQRQALEAQRAALANQIEEVEALEADLAAREEQLAAQEAELQGLRDEVAQAEEAAARWREAAQEAQRELLESLLVTLESNPRYLAAQAAVEAAEAQLSAAYNPASLTVEGSYTNVDADDIPQAPGGATPQLQQMQPEPEPGQEQPGGGSASNSYDLSATATFRPFPFGDTADLVRQQELALENAVLDFRETVASLQGQALESALQFRLARQSVDLADNTLEAARSALEATQTRAERGAANARELRDAEANFQESENFFENAQANLELARLSLRTLDLENFTVALSAASDEDIDALLALPRVSEGLPLSVLRSRVSSAQAAIGVGSAQRDLIPTAQASYSYNLDDRSSLSASLESRTLQPSVSYSYQDPERSLPESAVNGVFRASISASISFGVFDEISAAQAQRRSAEAGIVAAQENAELQLVSLTNALNEAERTVDLERIQFRNAQRAFEENRQRQELGLITPLETQQALVELLQADIELRQARFSALQALLDLYEFYALPPSEVLL